MVLIFTFCCRIGEAHNPGPLEPIIGCINPTGILGKTPLLSQLPVSGNQTIWAISETHLTKQGKAKLATELKTHKTGMNAQMGSAVPARSASISAVAGKHRGVGFLSTAPCREVPNSWSDDIWNANRIHASCFQVGARPVIGGVLYGYPVNPESAETQRATEELCQALSQVVVQDQVGLRFIGGDFNQLHGSLTSMSQWCDKGWVNAQKWAFDTQGIEVRNTCKGSTTKDHLFFSPQLAAYLKSVHVEEDWFPDHAILYARFHSFGSPPMIPLWRQPSALPWDKCKQLPSSEEPFPLPAGHPSDQYEALCAELEARVDTHLSHQDLQLQPHEKGRASTREVRMVQEYAHPPKLGRQGEVQPEFHGANMRHAQLLRQVRRLVNFQRIANLANLSLTQMEHRNNLWRKICKAPGFAGGFQQWWKEQSVHQVPVLPLSPPCGSVLNFIVDVTQKHLRDFETSLVRTRVQAAKQRRLTDANAVFRDLQKEPSAHAGASFAWWRQS